MMLCQWLERDSLNPALLLYLDLPMGNAVICILAGFLRSFDKRIGNALKFENEMLYFAS